MSARSEHSDDARDGSSKTGGRRSGRTHLQSEDAEATPAKVSATTLSHEYDTGMVVEMTLGPETSVLNVLPEKAGMTSIHLNAGSISVTASKVPAALPSSRGPHAQTHKLAPRFWRLIRRRRISIGTTAGMSKFGVESLKGTPTDPVTKVTVVNGHEVEVETDDGLLWYKLTDDKKWLEIFEVGLNDTKIVLMPDNVEVK
ncbi:MAG TPA: hypothetical protein VK157_14625 [Phycisphaerales bacterium]|nr:hypothetical protein [Phycisphaerales bacterium]